MIAVEREPSKTIAARSPRLFVGREAQLRQEILALRHEEHVDGRGGIRVLERVAEVVLVPAA